MTDFISVDEAIERGYLFGPIGYNHKEGRAIIATLRTIKRLSPHSRYSVRDLEAIREDQLDPEPAGDIPMVR